MSVNLITCTDHIQDMKRAYAHPLDTELLGGGAYVRIQSSKDYRKHISGATGYKWSLMAVPNINLDKRNKVMA